MTKQKKIQRMLDYATSIEIDGYELNRWTMDELQDVEDDDIVFEGIHQDEDMEFHYSFTAESLKNAEVSGNSILAKDDLGEECEIQCFKKSPYKGE